MRFKAFATLLVSSVISFQSNAQSPKPGLKWPTPTRVEGAAALRDNDYRNGENELYWGNRMPDAAYWQQDVQYKIYAVMREEDNVIDGAEELTYWNNSPDTLGYVYFHLYQNAFVKGSHLHELEKSNKTKTGMGPKEAAGLGTTTEHITVDGATAQMELDNTIMKVFLPKPMAPGAKVVIKMSFKTYYDNGLTRRRMQMYNAWGFKHYNGVQWFPKISVYDRMHGWDTYQHLNKEFYGDYGLYDVTLDFPSNYIVEATGVLQNRKEMLPDTLRAKLDIKNFANKKWNEPPSTIIPYVKGKRKAWHFVGNNIHDFAFTADPSFRLATAYWNGVECVAVAQEPHASGWQNAADYMTKIIKTFSEDIGMYRYPKIVAADAQDGMEYPMLTLDGGSEPGYRGLLVHEIGHNWFYGQVGSNETYRAAMDEGFTQFLTAWGLRKIDGDTQVTAKPKSRYRQRFSEPVNVLDRNVLSRYTMDALNQNEVAINTHSDDFNGALNHGGGYGLVYFKTASMLYNLQYVLGDSLFEATIHHYFEQWKFAHPYFEDFRASVIQFTHNDLSWFFDEWFETTKTLDYGIGGIRKIPGQDSFAVKFRRTGAMQMPIDFTVTGKDGVKHDFYIPNTWWQKQTSATILPKWYGWGKLNETYSAHVRIPSGIRNVRIDTTCRLADVDMVDNYKSRSLPISPKAIKTMLDGGTAAQSDRRQYRLDIRPDLWWNPIDGVKAGAHFEGDYLFSLYKLDATVWMNTHLLQENTYKAYTGQNTFEHFRPVNYTINYNSPITRNTPKLQLQLNSRYLDGEWYHRGGFNWLLNDRNVVQAYAQSMWRYDAYAKEYLTDPADWNSTWQHPNTSLNLAWAHSYSYVNGAGKYTLSVRAPMLNGDNNPTNYSYAQIESINSSYIGLLEVKTRVFGRYGMGTRLPYESLLYMAGASPEEQMENKYTRSVGFIPTDWQGISDNNTNHFQQGGGLNLRGYVGYYAPDQHGSRMLEGYKGRSGAAVNVELGVENYMPWHPKAFRNWLHANVYGFGDAGAMELSNFGSTNLSNIGPTTVWSTLHMDAGMGMAFTIKNWGVFDKARPLTLRLDLPIFLNRPPYGNDQYATLRYVIGVNRAF